MSGRRNIALIWGEQWKQRDGNNWIERDRNNWIERDADNERQAPVYLRKVKRKPREEVEDKYDV